MCEFVGLNPTGGRSFWCFSKLKRLELAKYKVRGEGKGHYWKLAILFCRSFPLDHLPFLLLLFACLKIWIVFAVFLFCFCCRVWVCVFMFLIYCWWANWTKYFALHYQPLLQPVMPCSTCLLATSLVCSTFPFSFCLLLYL